VKEKMLGQEIATVVMQKLEGKLTEINLGLRTAKK